MTSRLIGFVRERIFAHYFGNSDALDAFRTALKVPNLLQNLFGDQAISASFIPVYTQLWERDRNPEEARRVAWTVGSLLAFAMAVLVLVGVLATPLLIDLIAPGFEGAKRELTIRLVRITVPRHRVAGAGGVVSGDPQLAIAACSCPTWPRCCGTPP